MPIFFLALATPTLFLRVVPAWARQKFMGLLPFKAVQEPLRLIGTLDTEARRMVDKRRAVMTNAKGDSETQCAGRDILSVLCGYQIPNSRFDDD